MNRITKIVLKALTDDPDRSFITNSRGTVVFFLGGSQRHLMAIHSSDKNFNGMTEEEIEELISEFKSKTK